jgi:hypothetical protein
VAGQAAAALPALGWSARERAPGFGTYTIHANLSISKVAALGTACDSGRHALAQQTNAVLATGTGLGTTAATRVGIVGGHTVAGETDRVEGTVTARKATVDRGRNGLTVVALDADRATSTSGRTLRPRLDWDALSSEANIALLTRRRATSAASPRHANVVEARGARETSRVARVTGLDRDAHASQASLLHGA